LGPLGAFAPFPPSGAASLDKKGAWCVVRGAWVSRQAIRSLSSALFFLPLFAIGISLAQALPQPVDPLKRPEPEVGKLTFSASLGYRPHGYTRFGLDENKGPYADQTTSHALTADLAFSYAVSEVLSLGLGFTGGLEIFQTLRTYTATGEEAHRAGSDAFLSPRAVLTYRLAPENLLDPSASLTLRYPWKAALSLSLSYLRDPTVLSFSAGFSHSFMSPFANVLTASVGAGFVANDRVSYRLSATLSQPLAFAAAPTMSGGFGVDFALDPEAKESVSLDLSASLRGGVAEAGLALAYQARGVRFLDRVASR